MNTIENVFICITAPLLFAVFCARRRTRQMLLFLLAGMFVCLLSSYISAFLAEGAGADYFFASMEISPLVEEIMKFLPVLFFLLVFEPKGEALASAVIMTAVGFATFENICFLVRNENGQLLTLAIRGFCTGAMHVMCGYVVALGLLRLWDRDWLRIAGMPALLVLAASYHGVYNVLVSQGGAAAVVGYCIPLVTAGIGLLFRKKLEGTGLTKSAV